MILLAVVFSFQIGLRKTNGAKKLKVEILSALADVTYCSETCSIKPGDLCFKCDVCDIVIDYDEASQKASHCIRQQ